MRWHLRKGWDVLIDAFSREFAGDPHVRLIVKARPFDPADPEAPQRQLDRHLRRQGIIWPRNLVLQTDELKQQELVGLYKGADAFVLPSRGEGWGRPFIEAMLAGLPVIGPRWGGNLDFMNDDNAILLDGSIVPVSEEAAAEWPYFAGHRWFESSRRDLQAKMRALVTERNAGGADPRQICEVLLRDYCDREIGQRAIAHLSSLS